LVATSGDQVRLRIKGVEEEDISIGFVLCTPKHPVHVVNSFEAQVAIIELKNLLTAGYGCVMHVHTAVVEVQFEVTLSLVQVDESLTGQELLHKLNKLNQRSKKPPPYAKKGQKIVARLRTSTPLCLERFEDYPMLGRFTLRDQGNFPSRFIQRVLMCSYYCCYWKNYEAARRSRPRCEYIGLHVLKSAIRSPSAFRINGKEKHDMETNKSRLMMMR